MPDHSENEIRTDHEGMDAVLKEGRRAIADLQQQLGLAVTDGAGLDPAVAESLRSSYQTTSDELTRNQDATDIGNTANQEKQQIAEEGAADIDAVTTELSSGGAGLGAGATASAPVSAPAAGTLPGGQPLAAPDPSTGLSSGPGSAPQPTPPTMPQPAPRPIPPQPSPEQLAARQAMINSQAWEQAMAAQQNRALMNQVAAPFQGQVIDNAIAQQATHEGQEISPEEIETIIKEVLDDGGEIETGSADITESSGSLAPAGTSGLSTEEVSFDKVNVDALSDEQIRAYTYDAMDLNGIPDDPQLRERISNVMVEMAKHESGGDPNAGNAWDSNAVGPTQVDGLPAQSSRGTWQTIPSTFAAHHIEGTSNSIYDPQASAAAALHYMMEQYDILSEGGLDEFARSRGIDPDSGKSYGGYHGY